MPHVIIKCGEALSHNGLLAISHNDLLGVCPKMTLSFYC